VVIDDDPLMLRTWKRLLEKRHHVRTFSDPVVALSILELRPPDVLLLDLQMPSISGLDFLERIKAMHPRTECIVVSGTGTIQSAVEALKLGAADYLTKPLVDIN